jgi:hypothetical protein
MVGLYSAYGLLLETNIPIPGLPAARELQDADVSIRFGVMPDWVRQDEKSARVWHTREYLDDFGNPTLIIRLLANDQYFHFAYSDGTEFLINSEGSEIFARWPLDLTLADTATYLLGPILGFVLLLRGVVSLHASAIAVNGCAVAILGPGGAGKSTTAATFAKLGYAVLADDIVTLDPSNDRFLVHPAHTRIRLWPTSVEALYGSPDALPRLTPSWDKLYLDLTTMEFAFQPSSLPLAAIYLLGPRGMSHESHVTSMSASDGLMALVGNTYANYLKDRTMRKLEFHVLQQVVEMVPVRRVNRTDNITDLPNLCELILQDFESQRKPARSALASVQD